MDFKLLFIPSQTQKNIGQDSILNMSQESDLILTSLKPAQENNALAGILSAVPSLEQIKNLRKKLEPHRIDLLCIPVDTPKKKLLLADMDSTIVQGETLDDLAAFAGVKDKVEEITTRAMNGELDFEQAIKERVQLLKNLSTDAVTQTAKDIQIMPGAKEFINTIREQGGKAVLVTGGFSAFSDDIARKLCFDHVHANTLEIKGAKLTGKVIPPILDKHAKLNFLNMYVKTYALDTDQTIAIGDGANDLPMLEAAGIGIGYKPKPIVADALRNVILYGDLRTALYAL